jgi:Uma2 family endonuclease
MADEVLMQPAPASVLGRMTYEQFLQWDGPEHVEWVDGEIIPMSPVTAEHSLVEKWLSALLQTFLEARALGKVFGDPFQMKTGPNLPGRASDICVLLNQNLTRQKRLHIEGPADLVVEIISPGSRSIDRGDKFYEYEEGGVPEYWLIDPERKQAEFYLRGSDGIYRMENIGSDGIYGSKILDGVWLKVEWLWERPPVIEVLKLWKLVN